MEPVAIVDMVSDMFLHRELEFSVLYQTQRRPQPSSKQYLLVAASCNLMVLRFPFVYKQPLWTPTNPCLTMTLLASSIGNSFVKFFVCLFVCFFWLHHGMRNLPGQRLNPCHSSNLSHSSHSDEFLTH